MLALGQWWRWHKQTSSRWISPSPPGWDVVMPFTHTPKIIMFFCYICVFCGVCMSYLYFTLDIAPHTFLIFAISLDHKFKIYIEEMHQKEKIWCFPLYSSNSTLPHHRMRHNTLTCQIKIFYPCQLELCHTPSPVSSCAIWVALYTLNLLWNARHAFIFSCLRILLDLWHPSDSQLSGHLLLYKDICYVDWGKYHSW